jgi:hypothetical protein
MSVSALNAIKLLLNTPSPAELGPARRTCTQLEAALNVQMDELLHQTKLPAISQQLVRGLILLWHDHLDASHTISQSIENSDGSFVHAIMHRRELDYGNSKYWFRRAGRHPAFPEIAQRVAALLESKGEVGLLKKLVPGGQWDAFAFVDACERPAKQQELLREIQWIEFEVLLERFLGNLPGR